jgi:hypothetical protein
MLFFVKQRAYCVGWLQAVGCTALAVTLTALLTFVSPPAVAQRNGSGACSAATLVGTYNYETKGFSAFHVRGKTVQHAAKGTIAFDGNGNYLINKTASGGGKNLVTTNAKGTYTVDASCNYLGKRFFAEDNQVHVMTGVVSNGGNYVAVRSEHQNQSVQGSYSRVSMRF